MIVAISGKINSGKDTVGNIIQILIDSPHFTNEAVISFLNKPAKYSYINMKFADSLKDMVCILLSCTREQLEDREFKEKELGEEWWYYNLGGIPTKIKPVGYYPNQIDNDIANKRFLVKPTPRLLLQQLGTECGRNILHPNVWVNSLMSKYKMSYAQHKDIEYVESKQYPNWVITDLRFPNELKTVKDRGGISIRVNRSKEKDCNDCGKTIRQQKKGCNKPSCYRQNLKTIEHESETALDNVEHDVTIDNNGTLSDLVDKCREVVKKFELK